MNTNEIRGLIKGEVSDDKLDLFKYSHDASIFEIQPQLIVFPKDADDIKRLVRYVADHKKDDASLSLTARSAGTDMSGGPLNDSIIIDFTKHINSIGEIHENNVVVEPGVFYRDLEKVLTERDLQFV